MIRFSNLPVGAYFSISDAADSTLCVKESNASSYRGYGQYRFADYRNPMPYLIADWCDVCPRDDLVIIRRDRETGTLVAFMPEASANPGMIVCYAHIGQHGEACRDYMLGCKTVGYDLPEVQELVKELVTVGYGVRLVKRMPSWRVLARRRDQLDK
jgi:hypothetical protein